MSMTIEDSWIALLPRLEADLKARAAGGLGTDDEAWRSALELLQNYGRVIGRRFGSLREQELDDLIQDTLVKLQSEETMQRMKISRSPAGYVAVVMRHAAIDLIRRQQRTEHLEMGLEDTSFVSVREGHPANADRSLLLRSALLSLSDEERTLLKLRFWKGFSISEIAQQRGLTYAAAATRLFRILHKLRLRMSTRGFP